MSWCFLFLLGKLLVLKWKKITSTSKNRLHHVNLNKNYSRKKTLNRKLKIMVKRGKESEVNKVDEKKKLKSAQQLAAVSWPNVH